MSVRTKPSRAAIYCRISRDAEQEGLGVARQEEDCRRLAEREGFTVTDVYVDNDISASTKSRKLRPSYNSLLADARSGRIDVILAYSNSRLTRRPAEWIELIDLANTGRIRIKTCASGEHDLATANGRAMALTVAAWDAREAEETAEKVVRAHKQLAESGAHIGRRPFGWDFNEDRTLRINEAEASVVRECAQRVLTGEGIWKITRDLNDRGIVTSTGKPWATQVLRRLLLRWRNCGLRSHQPMGPDGKRQGPVTLSPAQWEPLYDRETHERVLALLTDPSRRSNNRGTEAKYLLTSVAYCGECGRHVVGTNEFVYRLKNGRTRVYPHAYKCPHAGCMKVQRRMADVDEHVTRVVLGVLQRDGVRLLGGDPAAAEEAGERIAVLLAKLALAADKFAEGEWTDEQVSRINANLKPKLEAAQAKLRAARPEPTLAAYADSDSAKVAEAWQKADVETRKRIIRLLGMRITINRVGAGNGRAYDPEAVTVDWPSA